MARQLLSAAINTARDAHYVLNPATGLYERSLLLEGASTNLCLQSENFGTTWSAIGTPTRTALAIPASVMGVGLDLMGDDSASASEGYQQNILFTGDAVKAISAYLKKGSSPGAGGNDVVLRDSTAAVTRLAATITWDAAGVPTVVMTTGVHLGTPIAYTDGVYRFRFQTTAVTAANSNALQIYGCRSGTVSETGNVYAGGVQAEDKPVPTSYMKTTTATVSRTADVLSFPFAAAPQEMTVYARFIEQGMILVPGARVFTIGNAAATTSFLINSSSGKYKIFHDNGTGNVNVTAALAPSVGDLVELRGVLGADGSVFLGQSINGGAEVLTAVTAAKALASAWAAGGLSVGGGPSIALQALVILPGTQSLATMRLA